MMQNCLCRNIKTYKNQHTQRAVFTTTLAVQEKARMRPVIVILLFVFILSRIMLLLLHYRLAQKVYSENFKRDELVVKLNNELLKTKEKLTASEGKVLLQ